MKKYVIYDDDGTILRSGVSSERSFVSKAKDTESIMEVPELTKNMDIEFRVEDKHLKPTSKKAKVRKKPPHGKQWALITNEQLQSILNRLTALESHE